MRQRQGTGHRAQGAGRGARLVVTAAAIEDVRLVPPTLEDTFLHLTGTGPRVPAEAA